MNCSRWHQMIALYVGGDLGPDSVVRVEQHLENCPACRDLAEELVFDREVLTRLDAEAASEADLGSVRGAVLAEITGRRPPFIATLTSPQFTVAAVAVAAVIAVFAIMIPRSGQREPLVAEDVPRAVVPVVEEAPEISDEEPPAADETAPRPQVVAPPTPVPDAQLQLAQADEPAMRSAAVSPSVPSEPMTMKILTSDPDVVIYWIVDSKGAEDA